MDIKEVKVDGYQKVMKARDPASGLHALIAVHDTTLGRALGGMRMWPYESEDEALRDVLRLAEGMTFKSAVAETGLGGGKSVIIGDSHQDKSEELFRAMGRFVDSLEGLYITAEDVGTSVEDMVIVRQTTPYVSGLPREMGGSGDPSPFTALGVFEGIKVCLRHESGRESCRGRSFAIQGLGHVGAALARHLSKAGGELVLADIEQETAEKIAGELGGRVVDPEEIYDVEADVFVPCALGGIINDDTLARLKCRIIAGAANNQLEDPARHGTAVLKQGILYAPDFVINAGGIINVSIEFAEGGYEEALARRKIANIARAVDACLTTAKEQGIPTNKAARVVARKRLEAAAEG